MEDQNDDEATTELNPTDDRICQLLAEGWTHARIGAEVGVSAKTIQRRLQVPEFASELIRRRRAAVAATTAALEHLGVAALASLRALLDSDDDRLKLRSVELGAAAWPAVPPGRPDRAASPGPARGGRVEGGNR